MRTETGLTAVASRWDASGAGARPPHPCRRTSLTPARWGAGIPDPAPAAGAFPDGRRAVAATGDADTPENKVRRHPWQSYIPLI